MQDGDLHGAREEREQLWWAEFRERLDTEQLSDDPDDTVLREMSMDEWNSPWFQRAVEIARNMGYQVGYQHGVNDLGQLEAWQEGSEK
jgi:hypothetical protein